MNTEPLRLLAKFRLVRIFAAHLLQNFAYVVVHIRSSK
jgi:hypothetical protein